MMLNYFTGQFHVLRYYFTSGLDQKFYSECTEKYLHLLTKYKVLKLFTFNNYISNVKELILINLKFQIVMEEILS